MDSELYESELDKGYREGLVHSAFNVDMTRYIHRVGKVHSAISDISITSQSSCL